MSESPSVMSRLIALSRTPSGMKAIHEVGRRGRKPAAPLPTLTIPGGGNLSRYAVEKLTGIRRENGAVKLRRLTARHYKIIGMHLEGASLERIAAECKVTFTTISRVLNDPLAVNILQRAYKHREGEIHALAAKAVDVTREGMLGDHTLSEKLKAVNSYVKLREVMIAKDEGRETAEDVIARILSGATVLGDVNVQVNQNVERKDG